MVEEKHIITVKEARKLLGKDYCHLSDDLVETMLSKLQHIAEETVQDLGSNIIY